LPPGTGWLEPYTKIKNNRVLSSKFGAQTVDIEVKVESPSSLVVVAQTYYHAWRAEIDGKPTDLVRANYAFQAVLVPSGTHHVHLFYRDLAFDIGAAVSFCTWVGCAAGYFTLRRRESPKNNSKKS